MTLETNLINIVLVDTIHPGNIGSVARAMKTMGLQRLSLVNPRVFPSSESTALAGNATDVLENATIFDSIKDAIKDSTFVYATSARDRSIQWPIMNAEQAANDICNEVNSDQLQRLIDHFIETAVDIDVIDPDNPKKIILRIKRMFTRLQPDEMEARFMRGFLSAIQKKFK